MPATNELLQEGRYRINQQIPLGGNGKAYEAYDTVRDANVVVKEIIVRLNRVGTTSQQESLKLEFASQAKILTEIKHDSLLHVHDYFSEIDRQYLVMESVDGDDLAELLERNKSAFAVSDVVDWADQILDALNYLHTFKPPVIHRNIRPQHIKLNSAGKIKLLAFGMTERDDARLSTTLKEDSAEPQMNYAPLELIWDGLDAASQKVISNSYDDRSARLLKEPADARSDIYSLGATLYHLVTGQTPVDPLERSIELLEGNPDPLKAPHKIDPKVPVELSEVLMRSLEIKRENRFDSAVIMRQVIRTAMVRVREREAVNVREQEEAAEDIRLAEQRRKSDGSNSAEKEQIKAQTEQKRRQELLAEQLREAEAQRLEAEKAESERQAKEKMAAAEAALSEVEKAKQQAAAKAQAEAEAVLKELKQDLLDIDAEPEADTKKDNSASANKTLPTNKKIEKQAEKPVRSESKHLAAAETADVAAYGAAVASPESRNYGRSSQTADEIELGGMFSETAAPARKGLGMPVIGGIGAVVLIVVAAAWFLLSSGSSAPEPAASQAPAAAQTAPIQSQPVPAEASQESVMPEIQTKTSTDDDSQSEKPSASTREAAQAAAAKAKKAEPAKPAAEKKKAVTVDDLINDN